MEELRLNLQDVRVLYGDLIFAIPESQPVVAPQAPPLSVFRTGPQPVWKMKPQAKIALLLEEAEFSNKQLTGQLRDWILAAEIPTEAVGFGILPTDALQIDLAGMPANTALGFSLLGFEKPFSLQAEQQALFFTHPLREILGHAQRYEELKEMLRMVKFETR